MQSHVKPIQSMNFINSFIMLLLLAGVTSVTYAAFDRAPKLDQMSEEQAREKTRKRGMLCLLDVKLEQLNKMLSQKDLDQNLEQTNLENLNFKKLAQECKELCVTCDIDGTGVEWDTLAISRGLSVGCNSVAALSAKVQMILTKVCDIQMSIGGPGMCGIPIYQADLPLTIAAGTDDRKSYFFAEPLTHAGGSSAITITASGLTIDMCGQRLDVTTDTGGVFPGWIHISGNSVTIKNGIINSTSSFVSPIRITSTAIGTVISNILIQVSTSTVSNGAIMSEGPDTRIRDVDILINQASSCGINQAASMVGLVPGAIWIERCNIFHTNDGTGEGILLQGNALVRHTTIRTSNNYTGVDIRPQGATDGLVVLEDLVIIAKGPSAAIGVVLSDSSFPGGIIDRYVFNNLFIYGTSGIVVNAAGRDGVISNCQVSGTNDLLSTGISVAGPRVSIINNRVCNCEQGYLLQGTDAFLEHNVADSCSVAGFQFDLSNGVVRDNTALSNVGGIGTGFLFSGTSLGWTVQRNNSTGYLVGFSDLAAPGANFFASNYAVGPTPQFPASGFFTGTPAVIGIAASTSYWDNLEA